MTPAHPSSPVELIQQRLQESLGQAVLPIDRAHLSGPERYFQNTFQDLSQAVVVLHQGGQVAYLNAVLAQQQNQDVTDFQDLNLTGFNWQRINLPPETGFHSIHWGEPIRDQPAAHHLRLEQLFSAMTDIIMVFDREGTHLDIAPTNPDLLYRPAADQMGKTMFEVFDADFARYFTGKIRNALDLRQKIEFEYHLMLHHQKTFFAASLTPLDDDTVMLIARDITRQKTAELALVDSEKRLSKLLKRSPVAIVLLDSAGNVLQVNDRFERTYGYTHEEVKHIDQWWSMAYPNQEYREVVQQRWQQSHKQALEHSRTETTPEEYWITTRNGEVRITEITAAHLGDLMMVVFNDITERRQAELELQDHQARLSGIIDSAMDAIITIDAHHTIRLFNRAAEQIFHCSAEDVLGTSLDRFIPGQVQDVHRNHVTAFGKSGTSNRSMKSQVPLEGVRAGGEVFPIEASISHTTVHGETLYTVILRDITERQKAELDRLERLVHMELLNTISRDLGELDWEPMRSLNGVALHLQKGLGEICAIHLLQDDRLELKALQPEHQQEHARVEHVHAYLRNLAATDDLRAFRFATRTELPDACLLPQDARCALLMVPLQLQGKLLGTITLLRCSMQTDYSAQEQALVQTLADRVALMYRNAQLYQDNLKQAQHLREANSRLEQRIQERTFALQEANQLLQKQALEDALTGLANRRHFNQVLKSEVRRACRKQEDLSLILCDVDFFKRYNDHYGHLQGDQALQEIARVLKSTFQRAGDCCARFGGEEFAVILPHTSAIQARMLAERLLQNVRDLNLEHLGSLVRPTITISVGVVTAQITRDVTPEMLVHLADEALYDSKDSGRNRVSSRMLNVPAAEENPTS